MKAHIDKDDCIGCGACEQAAPDLFRMGEYHAYLISDDIDLSREDEVRAIAADCPTGALTVKALTYAFASQHHAKSNDKKDHRQVGHNQADYRNALNNQGFDSDDAKGL